MGRISDQKMLVTVTTIENVALLGEILAHCSLHVFTLCSLLPCIFFRPRSPFEPTCVRWGPMGRLASVCPGKLLEKKSLEKSPLEKTHLNKIHISVTFDLRVMKLGQNTDVDDPNVELEGHRSSQGHQVKKEMISGLI